MVVTIVDAAVVKIRLFQDVDAIVQVAKLVVDAIKTIVDVDVTETMKAVDAILAHQDHVHQDHAQDQLVKIVAVHNIVIA